MLDGIILKGVGGLYTVDSNREIFMCKPRGIFRKDKISPLVGDNVAISTSDNGEGIIETIYERKSVLTRPKIANITQALMVFACKEPDLHLDLLDRFTINCEAAGIKSVICFNKADLIPQNEAESFERIKIMYENCGYTVLTVSAHEELGVDELKLSLQGEITVLAGPSGAGKSSIFNNISDSHYMETGELSERIRRGKHTTRYTQLVRIGEDSFLADSPGFSSVFLGGVNSENLKYMFREFKDYNNECRFINCSHIDEPDCAVKNQVSECSINEIRYNRYVSFFKEVSG